MKRDIFDEEPTYGFNIDPSQKQWHIVLVDSINVACFSDEFALKKNGLYQNLIPKPIATPPASITVSVKLLADEIMNK